MTSANMAPKDGEREAPGELASWVVDLAGLLISLAVSAVIFLSTGSLSSRGLTTDLGISGATAVLVGAASDVLVRRIRPLAGALVVGLLTLAILGGASQVLKILDTRPGRDARHAAAAGTLLTFPNTARPGHYEAGRSALGDGWGDYDGRTFRLHAQSDMSEMVSWFVSPNPGSHYYAEVTARKVSGDDLSTACVLSFGYQDGKNWWYGLEMVGPQVLLGREEFQPPGRRLEGPQSIRSRNRSGAHRLAVLRNGRELTLFVDDRRFFHLTVPANVNLEGDVTFGTLDTGNQGPGSMECQFSGPSVRRL